MPDIIENCFLIIRLYSCVDLDIDRIPQIA